MRLTTSLFLFLMSLCFLADGNTDNSTYDNARSFYSYVQSLRSNGTPDPPNPTDVSITPSKTSLSSNTIGNASTNRAFKRKRCKPGSKTKKPGNIPGQRKIHTTTVTMTRVITTTVTLKAQTTTKTSEITRSRIVTTTIPCNLSTEIPIPCSSSNFITTLPTLTTSNVIEYEPEMEMTEEEELVDEPQLGKSCGTPTPLQIQTTGQCYQD